ADREHYLFILALPWMLQMLLRLTPGSLPAAFAAAGCCIKPYNLLFLGVLTLYGGPREWTLRQRLTSRSALVIAAAGAAYLTILVCVYPNYLFAMLPLASIAYGAVAYPLEDRMMAAAPWLAGMIVLIAGIRCRERRHSFLAFALAASAVYTLNAG